MQGHKNLADGQSAWSSRDRSDFDELLWVTKSQTQRKNLAAIAGSTRRLLCQVSREGHLDFEIDNLEEGPRTDECDCSNREVAQEG